jgi:hypothetical protein
MLPQDSYDGPLEIPEAQTGFRGTGFPGVQTSLRGAGQPVPGRPGLRGQGLTRLIALGPASSEECGGDAGYFIQNQYYAEFQVHKNQ